MKRFVLLMTLALGFAGPVLALQQPATTRPDGRKRSYQFELSIALTGCSRLYG